MGGHGNFQKTKYHSVADIPDEVIPLGSKRDPTNPLYYTRRWVNFKKKQLLFSQNDGVPNYKRTRLGRFTYYGIWIGSLGIFAYNIYLTNKYMYKKKN